MLAFIDYPSFIKPEVFAFLNLPSGNFLNVFRWYGLMYIVAISISYFQSMYLLKKDKFLTVNKKLLDDYFFWIIIGLVLGARIFSCLIYDTAYYLNNPLYILFPFREGKFVGFQGMSYHGGAFGVFITSVIYARIHKINFRELCDLIFPVIPLGYTFGRFGNFINQELYGRVTSSPFGMLFPNAEKLPANLPDVQNVMNNLGWQINSGNVVDKSGNIIDNLLGTIDINGIQTLAINLPRHPSQLYEALFEGIILFFIVWFIGRKYRPFQGFTAPLYLAGYGVFRFFIEFLRQPDYQFADFNSGKYVGVIAAGLSMGQILCIIMFVSAFALGGYFYYLSKKSPVQAVNRQDGKNSSNKKSAKKR